MSMQEELRRKKAARQSESLFSEGPQQDDDLIIKWRGPGSYEQEARKENDQKVVQRGLDSVPCPRAVRLMGGARGSASPSQMRALESKDREMYGRSGALKQEYDAVTVSSQMHGLTEETSQRAYQCALKIEKFENDVEELCERIGLCGKGVTPGYLPGTVCYRALLLHGHAIWLQKQGSFEEAKEIWQKTFDACTFGLHGYCFLDKCCKGEDPESKGAKVFLFSCRCRAARGIGDLKQSLKDGRAARALINLVGNKWQRNPSIGEVTGEIVKTLGMMKLGAPRPHFTPSKLEYWQKELGLSVYARDSYKCVYCGIEKSDEVDLKQCQQCKTIWYCGRACQVAAWKGGHKQECKDLAKGIGLTFMPPQYEGISKAIDSNGFCVLEGLSAIMMKDPNTGEIFDSLTDEPIKMGDESFKRDKIHVML